MTFVQKYLGVFCVKTLFENKRKLVYLIILLFCVELNLFAENKILANFNILYYNIGYVDKTYVEREKATFAAIMLSTGIEYNSTINDINFGGGFSSVAIEEASIYNFNRTISKPFTSIISPYSYSGIEKKYFSIDLGVSGYFTIQDPAKVYYFSADGEKNKTDEVSSLNRKKSHAFVNSMIRILASDSLHIKARFAREDFIITDSLLNVAVIIPYQTNKFEWRVSLYTPHNYVMNDQWIMRNNQRMYFLYTREFGNYSLGGNFGFLIRTIHGDWGQVDLVSSKRLSLGVTSSYKW